MAWRAAYQQFRTIFRKRAIGAAAPTSSHTFQLIPTYCAPIVVLATHVRELMPGGNPAHSTLLHHGTQTFYSTTLLHTICSTGLSLSSLTPIPSSRCIFQQPVQNPQRRIHLLDPDPFALAQKSNRSQTLTFIIPESSWSHSTYTRPCLLSVRSFARSTTDFSSDHESSELSRIAVDFQHVFQQFEMLTVDVP
jgi:hypothetical protein